MWWVVLLIICWNFVYVNSLSLRDTHRFKKAKYWNIAHFCSEKRKNSFRWVHPGSLIGLIQKEEWSKWKPKYGIELLTSIQFIWVVLVKIRAKIKHIYSLLAKRRIMIGYFQKNMSKIPVDNESSLNVTVTLKIIALTYITLIETSVSVVYL
jgi:hypothetical protein